MAKKIFIVSADDIATLHRGGYIAVIEVVKFNAKRQALACTCGLGDRLYAKEHRNDPPSTRVNVEVIRINIHMNKHNKWVRSVWIRGVE
jgi:hypothetical protein